MNGRVPPQNIEAEMAVLGAMLLGDRTAIERVTEALSKEDFYRDAHGRIYEAMVALSERDEPVDIVTLQAELTRRGVLEQVGGYLYLVQLADFVPTTANITYYAKIVAEKGVLRRLIETASEIAGLAYGEIEEIDSLVDQAERAIFNVARKRKSEGFTPLRPLLTNAFERIDLSYHEKGVTSGIDTGFEDLNMMTAGLQRGDLVIIAARPSMGKTAITMNIGQNAASKGYNVAVFSLEMSKESLVQRMICSEARVDSNRLRTGFLRDDDWSKLAEAVQRLWDTNLFIDDSTDMSALEMRARCRRLRAEQGALDLVIVDYLQLMRGSSRNSENRNQEITEIARGLKSLARELDVPVIALSQLSRSVERREDKRPMLSDLRECLVGETRLIDADSGLPVPLRAIVPGQRVLAADANQRTVAAVVSQVWSKGIKPVFKVITETGRVLRGTGNHPFLTPDGYRPLRDLRPGARVGAALCSVPCLGGPIGWEPIRSIIPDGDEATYDISVPETGCFLAEGIVVHNSGAIEAEADLVGFIYRPAYYARKEAMSVEGEAKADEERAAGANDGEEAEIIIAKQRNGPTGTVKLAFIARFARFENLAHGMEESPF